MKLHSGNLETLPDDIPEVQTFTADDRGVPGRGHDRRRRRRGPTPRTATRSRPPSTGSTSDAAATDHFVDTGTRAGRGLRRRDHVGAPAGDAVRGVRRPRRHARSSELRADLAPAALDDLDAEYAVGGGAAESLDFVNQQKERLPLVIGAVLLLTLLIMGSPSAACRSRWSRPC